MPDFEDKIPISEFSYTNSLNNTDQMPIIQQDGAAWDNFRTSLADVGLHVNKVTQYTTDLHTTNDTIIGAINELADGGASADITTSITTPASVQTFNDGGDNIPLKSLVTEIVPIQASGTPSPSNPLPISGHNSITVNDIGKYRRIIPTSLTPQTSNGITVTPKSDGTFDVSGTATANSTVSFAFDSYVIYSDDGRKVAFNNSFADSTINISFRNGTTQVDGWSVSPTNKVSGYSGMAGKTIDNFNFFVPSGKTVNGSFRIEFYIESTMQTPVTISLGQTVYGGSLECVEGEGEITHGYLELDGSNDEQFNWAPYGSTIYINMLVSDLKGGTIDGACNWLPVHTDNTKFGVRLGADSTSKYILFDRITENISDVTDLASWRTYLSSHPIQIVYPLATPTSLSVTGANIPTLSGENNIYTDCGDIQSLEYFNENGDDIADLVRLMTRT